MKSAVILLFVAATVTITFAQESPYAGQEGRRIKSLSNREIAAYLAGAGMGFAKPAELNHYPGPKHVLELLDEMELTPEQEAQAKAFEERLDSPLRVIIEIVPEKWIMLDSDKMAKDTMGQLSDNERGPMLESDAKRMQEEIERRKGQ